MKQALVRLGIPLVALTLTAMAVNAGEVGTAPAPQANALEAPQLQSEDVRVGRGIVCDTRQQMERVAHLVREARDIVQATKVVNEEAGNPVACAMIEAAFVQGDEVNKVRSENGMVRVVEITVVAIPLNGSWQLVAPVKQYAAFPVKGLEI